MDPLEVQTPTNLSLISINIIQTKPIAFTSLEKYVSVTAETRGTL